MSNYKHELPEFIHGANLSVILEEISIGSLWIVNLANTNQQWTSSLFWLALGYRMDEIPKTSSPIHHLISNEDFDSLACALREKVKKGSSPTLSLRFQHRFGDPVTMTSICKGLSSTADFNQSLAILFVSLDSSSGLNVAYNETLLNSHLESHFGKVIFSIDTSYKLLCYNAALKNIMFQLYKSDVSVGMNLLEGICREVDRENAKHNFDIALGGQYYLSKGVFGEVVQHFFETQFTPIFDKFHRVVGVTVISTDMTERERVDEEHRQVLNRLSLATKAGKVGIWDWDIRSNTLLWDDQMYKLYGISEATFEGAYESWKKGLHPDDVDIATGAVEAALKDDKEFNTEFRVVWPDFSIHYIRGIGYVERNVKKEPVRMIGLNWDITESKTTEEKLKQSNNELESFSYSVSHDLRAPLRSINGYATVLQEDYASQLDDDAKRMLHTICRNAQKMGNLIDDLLAFSKLGRKQLVATLINFDELVSSVLEELSDLHVSYQCKASFTVQPLASSIGDYSLIKQVWLNLLANAIKYSSKVPHPLIEVGSVDGTNETTYFVKDNGVGFDMLYYNKLFNVFQRLHREDEFEGTGVGLANVHRIIARHGGRVWADASVNKGAIFYFSLPKFPANTLPA